MFAFVAELTTRHRVALDCGTGNGQAASGLASLFDRVIAIDPSIEQLRNAAPHLRIEYRVARAEASALPAQSVDLVTAAQALHWFDVTSFFAEARRVLIPNGAIAVWGYGDPVLDSRPLDKTLQAFNRGVLEPYWYRERKLLLDGYKSVLFPFEEVSAPALELEMQWTLPELAGYLRTWSATARYAAEHGADPIIEVENSLAAAWGDSQARRTIRWPLYVRAGRLMKRDSDNRS